uniref:Uncharacterized protein n=1 Tax=Panagrolaimus superbus TaxID=310955 RepID=A0A914YMZ3_9BILA
MFILAEGGNYNETKGNTKLQPMDGTKGECDKVCVWFQCIDHKDFVRAEMGCFEDFYSKCEDLTGAHKTISEMAKNASNYNFLDPTIRYVSCNYDDCADKQWQDSIKNKQLKEKEFGSNVWKESL